jgi:hypothetical protein
MERLKKAMTESKKIVEAQGFSYISFQRIRQGVLKALDNAGRDMPKVSKGDIPGPEVAETLHDDLDNIVNQLKNYF